MHACYVKQSWVEIASVIQLVIFHTNTKHSSISVPFSRAKFLRAKESRGRRDLGKCSSPGEYLPGLSEYAKQPRRFTDVLTFRAGKKRRLISFLLLQRDTIAYAKYHAVHKTEYCRI
ncbi:hypothetical protein ACS0PU_010976 [Formica fusca]